VQSLLVEKFCNALIAGAAPSELVPGELVGRIERSRKQHGGLWVGGKFTASAEELAFVPNAMNAALHVGLEPVHIPMAEVRAVRRDFGWVTGIVVVEHRHGEFRFRCFGAKRVANVLSSLVRGH
jgi:hypothetical protein